MDNEPQFDSDYYETWLVERAAYHGVSVEEMRAFIDGNDDDE